MPKSGSRLAIWSFALLSWRFPIDSRFRDKSRGEKPKMEINARESVIKTFCRERRWGRSFRSDAMLPGMPRTIVIGAVGSEAKREERRNLKSCESCERAASLFGGPDPIFVSPSDGYLTGEDSPEIVKNRRKKDATGQVGYLQETDERIGYYYGISIKFRSARHVSCLSRERVS